MAASTGVRDRLLAGLLLVGFVLGLPGCASYNKAPVESRGHHGSARSKTRPAVYIVRRGDTLFEIAWRYNLDYRRLARWNAIRRPYTIYPGQRLRLYPSRAVVASRARPPHAKKPSVVPHKPKPPVRRVKKPRKTPTANKPVHERKLHWRWPVKGQLVQRFEPGSQVSKGIRIAGRAGQAIHTAESGKVVYAGSGLRGYGKLIIIKHNNNYLSAYGFNRKLLVKDKQKVTKGQKIAEMGTAPDGRAMLHFEIRREGKPVDPLAFLP